MFGKFSRILFGGLFTISTLAVGSLYLFQNKLVYPSWAQGARNHVDTPDTRGLPYKRIKLTTRDGMKLDAFDLRKEESTTTVVILCPNAGNIGYFIPIMEMFYRQFNMSVFIYSYRGYGKSDGSPSEIGLKIDADSAMSYLATDEFHRQRKLVLYGRSIGGANAIYIASRFGNMIDAVILENTFLSITKVIPYIFPYLAKFAFLCHEVWNSEEEITKIPSEISFLFLRGLKDEIVPPPHMTELYSLCPSKDKEMYEFPLGHHNDTILQDGYWNIIGEYLMKRKLISK
ncbi:similar to Saccharomyces cerevisiae YNL320W Putative protein of unknown function [Maudiozyma barnettii]|uniref:AB hydrolase-1 domain-containing protein n=1 Tax=Maudiozyma barnettii TaxID=61262 RepID=A0A8H2ZGJ2_9SACH|nr:hypothetical protein [Kazachstania barnettii]CAB4253512.1 similar to Saccharomyces cerevisiae YNL320W Putative protein of unknown function [Kazachstania barnettii]CAD1781186.1 similar to Saccharomyces cerevisiae YNL320W Putative protein of unknown function [Kazachstania barnettii]